MAKIYRKTHFLMRETPGGTSHRSMGVRLLAHLEEMFGRCAIALRIPMGVDLLAAYQCIEAAG